jgi:hypothetical protein
MGCSLPISPMVPVTRAHVLTNIWLFYLIFIQFTFQVTQIPVHWANITQVASEVWINRHCSWVLFYHWNFTLAPRIQPNDPFVLYWCLSWIHSQKRPEILCSFDPRSLCAGPWSPWFPEEGNYGAGEGGVVSIFSPHGRACWHAQCALIFSEWVLNNTLVMCILFSVCFPNI